jgi:hypothetical protein
MPTPDEPNRLPVDEEPDPRLLWRWVGRATRPWVGWVFVGVGALLVLLGYLGVSREAIVEKQIPYLVSGGIGGVLLCVVGAYFLGTEELRKDSGRLDRLEVMVQELHAALLARPDAPAVAAPAPAPANTNGAAALVEVVAVEGGETFHRSDCAMAAGKVVDHLSPAEAADRGLRPCPLCEPVGAPA